MCSWKSCRFKLYKNSMSQKDISSRNGWATRCPHRLEKEQKAMVAVTAFCLKLCTNALMYTIQNLCRVVTIRRVRNHCNINLLIMKLSHTQLLRTCYVPSITLMGSDIKVMEIYSLFSRNASQLFSDLVSYKAVLWGLGD